MASGCVITDTSGNCFDADGNYLGNAAQDASAIELGISPSPNISGIPASSPVASSSGIGSDIASIGGALASLASSIFKTVNTPITATISPSATANAPYPVISNGQIVGYSATPTTVLPNTTGTLTSSTAVIIGAVLIGVLLLFSRRRG